MYAILFLFRRLLKWQDHYHKGQLLPLGNICMSASLSASSCLNLSSSHCLIFYFFLVPSFILPSTVFMSLIHSVDAGWKMWKSCKKQTETFSQKYSWICFMFLSLFKLLYFCFVNIIKLSPLHWANYSSYCIDTKPNMFITESFYFNLWYFFWTLPSWSK